MREWLAANSIGISITHKHSQPLVFCGLPTPIRHMKYKQLSTGTYTPRPPPATTRSTLCWRRAALNAPPRRGAANPGPGLASCASECTSGGDAISAPLAFTKPRYVAAPVTGGIADQTHPPWNGPAPRPFARRRMLAYLGAKSLQRHGSAAGLYHRNRRRRASVFCQPRAVASTAALARPNPQEPLSASPPPPSLGVTATGYRHQRIMTCLDACLDIRQAILISESALYVNCY